MTGYVIRWGDGSPAQTFAGSPSGTLAHVYQSGPNNYKISVDLLAGRIQFMFDFPTTAIQPIRTGKLKGLAVTSAQRSSELPDLPTVSEAGVKGYEFGTWFGILTPAGVPAAVLEKLTGSLMKTLDSPTTRSRLAQQAIEASPLPPQQFSAYLRADIQRWKKMLTQGHLAMLD